MPDTPESPRADYESAEQPLFPELSQQLAKLKEQVAGPEQSGSRIVEFEELLRQRNQEKQELLNQQDLSLATLQEEVLPGYQEGVEYATVNMDYLEKEIQLTPEEKLAQLQKKHVGDPAALQGELMQLDGIDYIDVEEEHLS